MVGIWYKTVNSAKDSKWLDLQVGGRSDDIRLIKRDVRIVLFVHIQVFYETISKEVIK